MRKAKDQIKMRMRRGLISVATFAEMGPQDKAYWTTQTANARLRAMELMRRNNYGKAATARLQRILEIVQSKAR